MDQQVMDRMRTNLSTVDLVKVGWAKIVLDLLIEIEKGNEWLAGVESNRAQAIATANRLFIDLKAARQELQVVEDERDKLQAQIDDMAAVITRSHKVEAMRMAMVGLIPSHRSPSSRCWCPASRDREAGHTDNCMRAQVACEKEK